MVLMGVIYRGRGWMSDGKEDRSVGVDEVLSIGNRIMCFDSDEEKIGGRSILSFIAAAMYLTSKDGNYLVRLGDNVQMLSRCGNVYERMDNNVSNYVELDVTEDDVVSGAMGILRGDYESVDRVPRSLGVETTGGYMDVLIPIGEKIPVSGSGIFTTYQDNQRMIMVQVYEGEDERTVNCDFMGVIYVMGIPEMPARVPRVCVRFDVDVRGILSVTATEESTGERRELRVYRTTCYSG